MDIQGKRIVEFGEMSLANSREGHRILFLSVIGEIEGHDLASGVCVVQHQIPVAVYVPVFSGYPDFGASRAYRRVFDGTDFGLSCYHYKMFAEIPSFFNVFRG